jgi:hypothetical protein
MSTWFYFLRNDLLTVEDKQVTFVTKLGPIEVKGEVQPQRDDVSGQIGAVKTKKAGVGRLRLERIESGESNYRFTLRRTAPRTPSNPVPSSTKVDGSGIWPRMSNAPIVCVPFEVQVMPASVE